jgi:hypothetical protein
MSFLRGAFSTARSGRLTLAPEAVERFYAQGFLALDDATTADDLARVRRILLGLYDRFDPLPIGHAGDLGQVAHHPGPQQIAEINLTVWQAPKLKRTHTFARCEAIASQLLGTPARHTGFDQAILKPPRNACATPWPQNQAYAGDGGPLLSVHFWIPLQDVSVGMGCMQFIPGSHREPLVRHERKVPRSHSMDAVGIDTAHAVACPLPLGGATVHLPRTLHFIGPNMTDTPRLAWGLEFAPGLPPRWPWRTLLRSS